MTEPRRDVRSVAQEVLNDDAQEPGSWHEVTVALAGAFLAAREYIEAIGPESVKTFDEILEESGYA